MHVTAEKLTSPDLMRRACQMTMRGMKESNVSLDKIYRSEHSPQRTQMFWVELHDIPTSVSVHLVRHKHGVEHFVMSNRPDRGGDGDDKVTRNSPVNHAMLINAEAILNISKARLCAKTHSSTREVWQLVLKEIYKVDGTLFHHCMPKCDYRGGLCGEFNPCGRHKKPVYIDPFPGCDK